MSPTHNKHGLSRHIPESVKREVRRKSGYGCVICGSAIVQYEHIDPEFSDCKEHNAKDITLLCPSCHNKVTLKLLPKSRVRAAQNNPKPLQQGFVKDLLYISTAENTVKIGGATLKLRENAIALILDEQPLLWFEPGASPQEPTNICAIFRDPQGLPSAYLNRNEFIGLVGNCDIKTSGTRISIRLGNAESLLINAEGGTPLHVLKVTTSSNGTPFRWHRGGSPELTYGLSSIGKLDVAFSGFGMGFVFGAVQARPRSLKPLPLSVKAAAYGREIRTLDRSFLGFQLGAHVYDRNFLVRGYVLGDDVYSLKNEKVGRMLNASIIYPHQSYPDGEPIWIHHKAVSTANVLSTPCNDVAYKIFGIFPCLTSV